jgi:hypothetical protein
MPAALQALLGLAIVIGVSAKSQVPGGKIEVGKILFFFWEQI